MLNRVILEGRLGADPEKFVTQTNRIRVRFPLPLFNPYQKEGEPTEWMQCEIWNQPAEFIAQYGKKGSLVSVDGRLRSQSYTDNEGNKKYRTYISVDRLTLLETRKSQEERNTQSSPPNTPQNNPVNNTVNNPNETPQEPAKVEANIDDLFKDFDGLMGN